jgi:hypothetical protein
VQAAPAIAVKHWRVARISQSTCDALRGGQLITTRAVQLASGKAPGSDQPGSALSAATLALLHSHAFSWAAESTTAVQSDQSAIKEARTSVAADKPQHEERECHRLSTVVL